MNRGFLSIFGIGEFGPWYILGWELGAYLGDLDGDITSWNQGGKLDRRVNGIRSWTSKSKSGKFYPCSISSHLNFGLCDFERMWRVIEDGWPGRYIGVIPLSALHLGQTTCLGCKLENSYRASAFGRTPFFFKWCQSLPGLDGGCLCGPAPTGSVETDVWLRLYTDRAITGEENARTDADVDNAGETGSVDTGAGASAGRADVWDEGYPVFIN